MEYAVEGGRIVPRNSVHIPLDHPGFLFGYGVYEVMPVVNGDLCDWKAHYLRIERSADLLGFELPEGRTAWEELADELVSRNRVNNGRLKIHVLGGTDPVVYMLTLPPWPIPADAPVHGVSCITFRGTRFLPEVKSTSLLVNYMAGEAARKAGAFEALLLNEHGELTEGSRTNFYLFAGRRVVTADHDILLGITRSAVLEAATALGFEINYRKITLDEVSAHDFDCLGVSSSSIGIVPVRSVNGVDVPFYVSHLRSIREHMRAH